MEKIYLSDSGPKVSPAVYGFYRWSGKDALDTKKLDNIVSLCLELGINTFDHADRYGDYEIEKLFGDAIIAKKLKREDIVLFTKAGLRRPHAKQKGVEVSHYDSSAKYITESVEQSLRNLRTDYIDIFLLERIDPISNVEETAYTLEKLRSSGKIRNIGITNFTVFQHQLLASVLRVPIVTNHIELNLLETEALDNGQLDYIKQKFMRPLVTSPLANGRIENGTDELASRVHYQLNLLAEKYNANIESLAVAWLVKLGALPLIGTLNEERIKNIANSFTIHLDHQDWYKLYNASKGHTIEYS